MDLIGIENEAEFFPSGTLSDVLKEELSDITARWAGLEKSAHPIERLSRVATSAIEALRQIRNSSDADRRTELGREMHHALLGALGYAWKREAAFTALQGAPVIPLISKVADASGRDALWIIDAPLPDTEDEAADPLGACFAPDQFPADASDAALLDRTIESVLADGVFELADGPRHVLVLGLSQIVLIDKRKWPARSVLRFDLQEIFTGTDRDTLTVMACLISREARVPEQGAPISDRLEEEAQRNANAVTTSLKRTVRDAIELLGQEVLTVTGGKNKDVWIDGPELSRECLRYMYRLLFLFYAEANPRLNLLDLKNPIYATGYSLETLRDLESVPLRTTADRDGTFLWESLQRTLTLLYTGLDLADEEKGSGLRLPAVKVSLLDPESTPLLNSLMLRNEAIQKVIRLLSLRSTGKSTGRISYAKLGIGQLGAVYETLISFTGVVAKTDLIELKPPVTSSNSSAEDEALASDEDDLDNEQHEEKEVNVSVDQVNKLAPSWFVPLTRIRDFSSDRVVWNGHEALVYPKGTFIYRLAGRDREKSASYYTPEPLARLLVKHALMERCRDLTADQILELKILEPAMGSAAFLVETTNQLADLYLERKQKETVRTIPQEDIVLEKQRVRAYIADRNCFGVDLNPIAVELGAISLWLNSLHGSEFSPWFGDQLHAGNSLIGARRAAYAPSLLSAKTQGDRWLNGKPDEIGWRNRLPDGHVWQWLLPAKGMANFDRDMSIAPFAKDAQDQIKVWRQGDLVRYYKDVVQPNGKIERKKHGFFESLEPHEIKLVQKLSRVAEALFDQVAEDLAKTRAAANDEITLWPGKVMPGNKRLDFHEKARLNAHLIGADHATNTLPYKRLKTAMDAWCALWLWPLDKTDTLPSWAEFLQGMAMILEGGFTADGSLVAPSVAEFADPAPDFLDILEPDAPARDLFKAAAKRQDGLFRETNVEALIESFDWLKTAVEVAERERFVHFDLIFADVMKERGGFDVIVGNPPWAKPRWNEADVLSEFNPRFLGLSAADARDTLNSIKVNQGLLDHILDAYVQKKGFIEATSSAAMCPFVGGGANNLYRVFVDLSFRLGSPSSSIALIHQDGHLVEPGATDFRRVWYERIVKHYQFRNEIKAKNFAEIGNNLEFSLNIYRGSSGEVCFENISGCFTASQVDECYLSDGVGLAPKPRDADGKRNTAGHRSRIVVIAEDFLRVVASIMEEGEEYWRTTRLLQPFTKDITESLKLFGARSNLGEIGSMWSMSQIWGETHAQKTLRTIKRLTDFHGNERRIISAPMIFTGNSFYQAPRRGCRSHRDYESIDLNLIPADFFPRSNYAMATKLSSYIEQLPKLPWRPSEPHSACYRIAYRKRVNIHGERSLICSLLAPNVDHIDSIGSIAFQDETELLRWLAPFLSLPFDFFVKVSGRADIVKGSLSAFPRTAVRDASIHRALSLTCVTEEFSDLWNRHVPQLAPELWSRGLMPLDLEPEEAALSDWGYNSCLRQPFARRLALVEIDVLTAISLGLSIDHLIQMYQMYFPVMQEYEAGTWYDRNGQIVWTCSKGLPGVGWLDDRGRSPGRAAWEKVLADNPAELTCTAIDDTMPGGPRTVTRHFVGPFTQCDRIEDYRRAWAHFERLKSEEAA